MFYFHSYQRGDLALFVPTKDPNIYCAVTNEPKKRIFLDRNSFKKYEDKFKSTTSVLHNGNDKLNYLIKCCRNLSVVSQPMEC